MSKRRSTKELTHDNWEAEEEREDMGTFRHAPEDELASRAIKKGRRRGINGENGAPSVFKGLSVFSSITNSSTTSAPPTFSFLNNVSKDKTETLSSKVTEKTSPPLKLTKDFSQSGANGVEVKFNGFQESKIESESEGKKDSYFLNNLKALNDGVIVWIKKHLDKNPHVNLSPVFDDYKKHFSELLKKYPPELNATKESESSAPANSAKKDPVSGKENTPLVPELTKESSPVRPFSFGLQPAVAEKSSESGKSLFSFGSKSSDTEKKSEPAPVFSFGGFSSGSTTKSEGLVFGNSNSSSSTGSGTTSSMFGGFNSSSSSKPSTAGFSFAGATSAPTTEKKDDAPKADEPSDEPPKVEVNVVKEDDALYEKKCKLFYMKDGAYMDRGVGTVYLKSLGEKTQLLVRAYTNLGNILLNIILNSSVPTVRAGKNGVILVCVPNPPIDTSAEKSNEPVKMLIKVKTSDDADALLEKLEEYKK